jgi:hypothetical protein
LRPPRGGGGGGGGRVTRAEKELWKNIFLFRSTKIRLKIECFSVWKIFVDGLKKSV